MPLFPCVSLCFIYVFLSVSLCISFFHIRIWNKEIHKETKRYTNMKQKDTQKLRVWNKEIHSFFHIRDMTHSSVWHNSFAYAPWLIHMGHMTYSHVWPESGSWMPLFVILFFSYLWHVWHDSFICVTWLIRMCAMTYSYGSHDSFTSITWIW